MQERWAGTVLGVGAQDGVTQKVAFEDRSNMRKLYSKAWQYLGKLHPDKGNIKSGYWGGIGTGGLT